LTTQPTILKNLCLDILLTPKAFQHLFLHWNSGVRGYYMRLLVWRLSRLGRMNIDESHSKGNSTQSKEVIKILLTFNDRLDAIRKRHDELSPESEFLTTDYDSRQYRRTTICSTRGVSDQPWAISELIPEEVCAETVEDKCREPLGPSSSSSLSSSLSEKAAVGKVMSWFRSVKRLGSGGSKLKSRTEVTLDQVHQRSEPQHLFRAASQDGEMVIDNPHVEDEGKSTSGSKLKEEWNESEKVEKKNSLEENSDPRGVMKTPESPTFFKFEFELGAEIPRSDSFDTPVTTPGRCESPSWTNQSGSPSPSGMGESRGGRSSKKDGSSTSTPNASLGPRVSTRFSKRASLLPPAALSMLKDNEAVPDVPAIPNEYGNTPRNNELEIERKRKEEKEKEMVYSDSKQPYAMRALAEYEQSLEEEFEWKEKLMEEDGINNLLGLNNEILNQAGEMLLSEKEKKQQLNQLELIVPRLAVSWPLSFSEDE
ncbi:hypothetical protein O181_098587, partial [Austropuccinia psidii MF-1]|nr:hypothetical protein [Austropuccinia psidii MF-1]